MHGANIDSHKKKRPSGSNGGKRDTTTTGLWTWMPSYVPAKAKENAVLQSTPARANNNARENTVLQSM